MYRNGGITLAVENQLIKYCENCKEETLHHAYEDALVIDFSCTQCNEKTEVMKSFF